MDANKLLKRRDQSKLFAEIKEKTKPKIDVSSLCKRRNNAKSDLDKWRSLLETAYHYAMPNYNPFENYGQGGLVAKGQLYNGDNYDLTLAIAHQKLADKMLMGMVPQGQQWMKFVPGDQFGSPDSDLYIDAMEATQRITDQFFKILDRSNFYTAVSESLNDVLVSTGILSISEGTKKNPIIFEAAPPSQVYLEGNAEGGIEAIFRDWYQVKVSNIQSMWKGATLPQNKEMDDKITIYECAYINRDVKDEKRYRYVVMTDSKDILLELESSSWPWVVYRMRKMTGEVRGRGPSMMAYPTQATIDKALEDELIAAAFIANPMYMAASDSAFNSDTFNPEPGCVIPVQMIMGAWPIQPLQGGGNISFSQLEINQLRQQVNDLMYAMPLGPVNAPDRTATEAEIRYQENLESFAAMIPRLQNEFFTPVIERCLWVINKVMPETFADIDQDMKQKLLSVDGQILGLAYETPLMTAKGKIKTTNVLNWYQSVAAVLGEQTASASVDPIKYIYNTAENQGVDLSNIKSKEELQQLLEAAANAATQEMQDQGVDIEGEQMQ